MAASRSPVSQMDGNYLRDDRSSTGNSGIRLNNPEDEDDKPSWSDLKTKAGKERKRLPLACIACRRKKIRCSGEKPACKHCLKSRIPCVYKVTTRKPAPRTDYMTMLDKRLKRMEERVIKISPENDATKLAAIGRSSVKPYVAPVPRSATTKKRFADEAFGTELNEWAGESTKSQLGPQVAGTDPREVRLMQEGREYLPSPEIQEHLSEVFFDYLYGQSYHVLHKPSFMRRLKAGKVPPVLILTLCALSARFSSHPQISGEPVFLRGEEWAEPARQIALRRYDEPNITILIVYLLLGLHEFGTCQGGRSWMFGGMALRMAYALQLHRELDNKSQSQIGEKTSVPSFTDCEIRRRTMWACFLMDRFNSSGTDRPTFSSEDSIKIQLPVREFNFQMEIPDTTEDIHGNVPLSVRQDSTQNTNPKDSMGLAAYLIKIISLWGKVVKYINLGGKQKDPYPIWSRDSDFAKLKRAVKEYHEELPGRLRYNPETLRNHAADNVANQFIFIHIACSQIVLFLHKFAIPIAPGTKIPSDAPKEFITQSAKTAIEAASRISMLVKDAAEHRVSAPFAGYSAFAACTIHVWGIFSSNPQLETMCKQNLTYGIKYLTHMKRHWGMFHHMVENLKSIYRQHADSAQKGLQPGAASGANEALFQYGDWFDKYPHGVSGTDFEDPVSTTGDGEAVDKSLYEKPELQTPEDFFKEAAKSVAAMPRKIPRRHNQANSKARPVNRQVKQEAGLGIPEDNRQMRNLSLSPTENTSLAVDTTNLDNFDPNYYTTSGGDMSSWNINNQPLVMSELDRHLVFGAYAEDYTSSPLQGQIPDQNMSQSGSILNQHTITSHAHNPTAMNPMLWDNNTDYGLGGMNGQGYQDVMSGSAWLMPFNLIPPAVGGGLGMGGGGTQDLTGDAYRIGSMDIEANGQQQTRTH